MSGSSTGCRVSVGDSGRIVLEKNARQPPLRRAQDRVPILAVVAFVLKQDAVERLVRNCGDRQS
ncbi:MAG: hypothetical protein ACYCWA_11305 [Thiobacillus sp.]